MKFLCLLAIFFTLPVPSFSEDFSAANENTNGANERPAAKGFYFLSALDFFGSFYAKKSIGLGYHFMIGLPNKDYPLPEWFINSAVAFELVDQAQLRIYTSVCFSLVLEGGISWNTLWKDETVSFGLAPEIKLRLPFFIPRPMGFLGASYRYNIYPKKPAYNYHEIDLSLFILLPRLSSNL
jgi:hypothetical protein